MGVPERRLGSVLASARREEQRERGAMPAATAWRLRRVARHHTSLRIGVPVLLLHGGADWRVATAQVLDFVVVFAQDDILTS